MSRTQEQPLVEVTDYRAKSNQASVQLTKNSN